VSAVSPVNEAPGSAPRDRWDELVQPEQGRVHRSVYTDPAIFELEMRKIFGGTWTYVGHETEIPAPHDFARKRIGLRPVIFARDKHGELRVLLNRCPHRGAEVCREAAGNAKVFVCGYHNWSFSSSGECIGIPLPRGYGDDFGRERLKDKRLGRLPYVASYRGFVFATFNPDVPPLEEHLADAREPLDYWIDRGYGKRLRVQAGAQRYVNDCNWKCIYDNGGDGYHPAYSHRSMLQMTEKRFGAGRDMSYFGGNIDDGPMRSRTLGNGHTMIDQRPDMYAEGRSAWAAQRPQPGREACEAQLVRALGREAAIAMLDDSMGGGINLNIFPNLLVLGNQIQVLEPLAVDRTQMSWYATLLDDVPEGVNTMRMRTQEDFPIFGEVDDSANFESCQAGMAIPELEWIDISRHMDKDAALADERGRVAHPVSSDLHMRAYFEQWRRIMKADIRFELG